MYMVRDDRTEKLRQIRDEVWNLKKSPLYKYRKEHNYYPVLGEGDHHATIMFIGEAPGENEAKTGRPFCGAAGKILDELLESIDVPREDVYITNIVKDRPPGNRDPQPEEIELYSPFLLRQIDIIQPKIIATLGRFSMRFIMEQFDLSEELKPISQIHGKVYNVKADYGDIQIVPLYHPAVVIYNPRSKDELKKDFQTLKSFYQRNNSG